MDGPTIVPRQESLSASQVSRTGKFDADLQRQSAKRLGAVALVYGVGILVVHGAFTLADYLAGSSAQDHFVHFVVGLNAAVGVAVFVWSRRGLIATHRFADIAFGFEILIGGLMTLGDWGWEHRRADELVEVAGALGIAAGDLGPSFVDPINALGISLIRMDAVPWLGAWILFYPMIVSMTPRRTLGASSLTALLSLAILALSVAVNGVPSGVGPWLLAFMAGTTITLFVIVLTAYFGSRFVYQLQRELSKAKRMGSYSLVERIGVGGMGEVWRADHRMLARPAAIKLIRKDAMGIHGSSAAHTALLRFEREAQATAVLTSPHSIQVYDFGMTDDGDFYYVMELLDGFDLRTFVEKFGAVPAERTIHFLRQASHSLWDAHLRGLTHRDVKPANLFVGTRLPEYDFVTVLDFGLVKSVNATGDAQVTAAGMATGTPAFMAPEVIEAGEVDGRSDLYALGCVAYWLLTGTLVFDAPSPTKVLLKHLQETPPPPSSRSELPIPKALDLLVLDCLAKDPSDRPQSAEILMARLDACASQLEPWTHEKAAAWWRLNAPDQRVASSDSNYR